MFQETNNYIRIMFLEQKGLLVYNKFNKIVTILKRNIIAFIGLSNNIRLFSDNTKNKF